MLLEVSSKSPRLPLWDAAEHGLEGVRLAQSVKDVAPIRFLATLNDMVLWPPVFPLMEFPTLLAFGYEYRVARIVVSVLFAGCLCVLFLAGLEMGRRHGVLTGGLAALLLSVSPVFHFFGAVVMLEIPGALWLLIAVYTYLRYTRTRRLRDARIAWLASLGLFFCKYSYGLLWLVPVAINEIWEAIRQGARPSNTLVSLRSTVGRNRVFVGFVCIYFGFMVTVAVSGGWVFTIAGQRISVRSLGNPTYLLIWILVIRFLLAPRKNTEWLRGQIRKLTPAGRVEVLPPPPLRRLTGHHVVPSFRQRAALQHWATPRGYLITRSQPRSQKV
jgi:hypothetical protein